MHNLIKFFSDKKYLDEFVSGQLYMNTLDYFWNNGFEEQKDIFEGVICTVPVKEFQGFPVGFQALQASDYHFRAEGYRYCNVLCFYKVRYDTDGVIARFDYDEKMMQFGEYVAFITNEREFRNRVETAAEKQGYKVLCGDVRYHQQMLNGKQSKEGNRMYLASKDRLFTVEELEKRKFSIKRRDCFDKDIMYCDQNEWRVALYRGIKDTGAYKLDVGDLSDIVCCFPIKDFQEGIWKNMKRYGMSNIDCWSGNIDRREMRELFYKLGDNQTRLFSIIG